ncbi:hypothetical protein [Maritimibacter alkaliphilus]|uniref:hypothetical protein n=1 Tax=Maritimibacter alkaliphilus TaxID=404236 RepID=UPI001C96D653|nr:hypothetical protein [Maritimibacter alkaliphilus]MBY6092516.1 hypothetical protein [Maritimibacter alkaliphilus]
MSDSSIAVRIAGLVIALGLTATSGLAAEPRPVEQHNSNAIWFENWSGLSNARLTIRAPNGELITVEATTGTPVYQLGREALDGVYQYELRAATEQEERIVNPIDNGRGDASRDTVKVSYTTSGRFMVARGIIITPEDIQESEG